MIKFIQAALVFSMAALLPLAAHATNGDNLIGVGAISRAMGGVGIAAPQDAISSTFSNPAAMCVGPFCPNSEFDFSATLLAPRIDGKVTISGNGGGLDGVYQDRADEKVYTAPAFGFTAPVNGKLRLGLSAYGITGLGVDYRDSNMFTPATNATQLMILKVAPTVAYKVSDDLSVGVAMHIVNSQTDFGKGTSTGYGLGAQLGLLYHLGEAIHLGATYLTAINADHDNSFDLDGDGSMDDFDLEAPQQFGIGIAFQPSDAFLFEVDSKWINWADAKGYDALDWDDQICVAVGAQFKPTEKLALRLGYNFAENQLEGRTFDGDTTVKVQGKDVNAFGFESLRVSMFPPIVEHHVTVGFGYDVTKAVSLNFGYMHAFEETVKSSGTAPTAFGGGDVELESKLVEDAVDFSIAWKF